MIDGFAGSWPGVSRVPHELETTVDELVRNLAVKPVQIVDVREPDEWTQGRIPGSVHMPMGDVAMRWRELDPTLPVVTVCRVGARSLYSAEQLLALGLPNVKSLAGGLNAWIASGQPLES
jgi:rhodanese-related sulfurtransferase